MLVKIKAKINHLPLKLKLLKLKLLKLIKANIPVKTGTQMINMIKRYLLAIMRISKPVMLQECLELTRILMSPLIRWWIILLQEELQEVNFQDLVSIMLIYPWWNQRNSLKLLRIMIG